MILYRTIIGAIIWTVVSLFRGLWLLFTRPITFMKFADEYLAFEKQIDDMDQVRASGYFDLTRAQRRALRKGAK